MKKVFFIIIIFPFVCFSQPTLDEKKALKVHNDAREEVGSPPLLWSNTTKVGIAYSKSKSGKIYVVARYYPAGNHTGEHPF